MTALPSPPPPPPRSYFFLLNAVIIGNIKIKPHGYIYFQGPHPPRLTSSSSWSRTAKNPDVSTEPLACLFTPSLTPLILSLALPCFLFLCAALRCAALTPSLTHSQARVTVNDLMAIFSAFFSVLDHGTPILA